MVKTGNRLDGIRSDGTRVTSVMWTMFTQVH